VGVCVASRPWVVVEGTAREGERGRNGSMGRHDTRAGWTRATLCQPLRGSDEFYRSTKVNLISDKHRYTQAYEAWATKKSNDLHGRDGYQHWDGNEYMGLAGMDGWIIPGSTENIHKLNITYTESIWS
jgi:hypothetical protein